MLTVIPAKPVLDADRGAGIYTFLWKFTLDSRFRGNDKSWIISNADLRNLVLDHQVG